MLPGIGVREIDTDSMQSEVNHHYAVEYDIAFFGTQITPQEWKNVLSESGFFGAKCIFDDSR